MPSISSVSPNTQSINNPATPITVIGTDFLADAEVVFDGVVLATTFVSATQLTATIPAPSLTLAGTYQIWVQQNSAQDNSNPFNFTVAGASAMWPKLRPGMKPARATLWIEQGKTFKVSRQLKTSDGARFDLTDVTMRLQVRRSFADNEQGVAPLLNLTTANGGITIDVPTATFTINISATDTTPLRFERARFELEATTPQGTVVALMLGDVRVRKGYVR